MIRARLLVIWLLVVAPMAFAADANAAAPIAGLDDAAHRALSANQAERQAAIQWLLQNGDRGSIAVLIQLLRWLPDESGPLVARLETLTGARAGSRWFDWMVWQQGHPEVAPYPGYTGFLADLLAGIDPRFRRFVYAGVPHEIRPEEIAWGGVAVDGIPALDNPTMIPAATANWHEMVNDVVGGVPVSLAYCTLCGAGIVFDGRVAGRDRPFTFGSSGLLYRSNKLMYDRQTDSLWNQFTGRPVVGRLTGSGIALRVLPVALSTWQQWHARHPATRVLALDTGFARDYRRGAAYGAYFGSLELLYPALVRDNRLRQKDLIFGLRVPGGVKAWPLADLAGGAVINDRVGFVDVVLIGDPQGLGARAYRADGHHFTRGAPGELASGGARWRVAESALIGPNGESLPRLP